MSWRAARSIDTTQGLGQEIRATNPQVVLYYIGDTSHQASKSDHNPCDCHEVVCAVDVMISGGPDLDQLAEHIRQRVLAGDQRTSYLIWNRRIFSGHGADYPAGQWRSYSGSNPHTDHIHLSIRHGPERYDDSSPWGWGAPALPAEEEEDDDMPYLFSEPSGAVWIVDAGKMVHVAGPPDLDAYRKAGIKEVGKLSDKQFGLLKKAYPPVA